MNSNVNEKKGIFDKHLTEIRKRLSENKPVRRIPVNSTHLYIDRQLPFICVNRCNPKSNGRGSERLVTTEPSYLYIKSSSVSRDAITRVLRTVIEVMSGHFGAFLLVEIWERKESGNKENNIVGQPSFRIRYSDRKALSGTIAALESNLGKVSVQRKKAGVESTQVRSVRPDGLNVILGRAECRKLNCYILGIEIDPIYRDALNGDIYPAILRSLRRGLSRALKRGFHAFTSEQTNRHVISYLSLGRRRVVKAVWEIDKKLAEIGESFDFLLKVTPTNTEKAWNTFKRKRMQSPPVFEYRPIPIDPVLSKRRLFSIPIEKIEDPTLEILFRKKQEELDRQLTMLADRNTSRFLHESRALYGDIKSSLVEVAERILKSLKPRPPKGTKYETIGAEQIAEHAHAEMRRYSGLFEGFKGQVHIRNDIYSGLMVSRGHLLIGHNTHVSTNRIPALLNHEIGTHALTYYNGKAQPFRQLYLGLDGYDELQEGLAVMGEYLVGGLTPGRLRTLAARVVAAQAMCKGADFIEVFKMLHKTHHFLQKTAFTIAMRVFRGGGLTKDAVYLRGFLKLIEYIEKGGKLDRLYVGKISYHHIPFIRELMLRKVLNPIPIKPRFLEDEIPNKKLEELRQGAGFEKLIKEYSGRR